MLPFRRERAARSGNAPTTLATNETSTPRCGRFFNVTLKLKIPAKETAMAYFEIRGGLKRLEFERLPVSSGEATCAVVEFVYEVPLPTGQSARITLGRHNGVVRELVGVPELVSFHDT